MKQLIEYIVSNLVNHPEDVIIEETKAPEEGGVNNIIIQVNTEDIGRVIGRSGKVINAIRQIARIAAIQKGIKVRVDLKEEESVTKEEPVTEAPVLEKEEPLIPEEKQA